MHTYIVSAIIMNDHIDIQRDFKILTPPALYQAILDESKIFG